jgi:hypothetical protein
MQEAVLDVAEESGNSVIIVASPACIERSSRCLREEALIFNSIVCCQSMITICMLDIDHINRSTCHGGYRPEYS